MNGFSDRRSDASLMADSIGAIMPSDAYNVQFIRFRYPARESQDGRWILDGVSFQVQAGEVLGVVGPNGSGKTSLLKVLARGLSPQEGRISLFGQNLASMTQQDVACVVGVVPQDTQQLFPFTVAETVIMGRFPHRPRGRWTGGFGWESHQDIEIAEQAMMTMDIGHVAHRAVTDLSGGERQRVLIARALGQTPKVLLLDEPTAFLDLQHQVEICSLLRRLKEERGLTVVLVSHDLNLVGQYCDRILLLDNGQVVRLGRPEEVIEPDVLERVYGCRVLVDQHPVSGLPRVTMPGRCLSGGT
ncbi:MAG: ABC transporter ATP-binding protein [Nitrospira sp.]|nr:ABC transporter ATP-binding protein [Nitrospira sp.]MDH4368733.1 ABC transporter ATP-binding protein [Nitrospira sp.]MDH5348860.1 ABC transporter ATP-binding protein [Nitrospira sp.]MDH5497978.1 ABC transporter ATP-binding protein [Nitrospira sp.]MDH5726480.1 ABC transporter ATP-binding protein [Nitrospira sp.]